MPPAGTAIFSASGESSSHISSNDGKVIIGFAFTLIKSDAVSSGQVVVDPAGGEPKTMYEYVPLVATLGSKILLIIFQLESYHVPPELGVPFSWFSSIIDESLLHLVIPGLKLSSPASPNIQQSVEPFPAVCEKSILQFVFEKFVISSM